MTHPEQTTDRPASQASPDVPHLVWLSAVTWDFPLVGRTRMLVEALRDLGHPTTFVQIPSYRTGVQRLLGGIGKHADPGVVRPWPILQPVSRWDRLPERDLRAAMEGRARRLRRQLEHEIDVDNAIALVVSPIWTPWLETLGIRTVVYDCIDDVEVMTPTAGLRALYLRWERELVERSSMVLCASEVLRRRTTAAGHRNAVLLRNGIDTNTFRMAAAGARPADLPPVGARPLVGFVGALYEWVDSELIGEVAMRCPEIDFVLVGPEGPDYERPDAPNVLHLGPRPYAEVPAYMQAFDVCWLPFREGDVARAADPIKLYEYLALGRPVVTSDVVDPQAFDGLIVSGSGADALAARIREALEDDPADSARRRAFADRNTWQIRARSLLREVATATKAAAPAR